MDGDGWTVAEAEELSPSDTLTVKRPARNSRQTDVGNEHHGTNNKQKPEVPVSLMKFVCIFDEQLEHFFDCEAAVL